MPIVFIELNVQIHDINFTTQYEVDALRSGIVRFIHANAEIGRGKGIEFDDDVSVEIESVAGSLP